MLLEFRQVFLDKLVKLIFRQLDFATVVPKRILTGVNRLQNDPIPATKLLQVPVQCLNLPVALVE